MNNHFQSRETTSTVIGFWSETIGLNGSSELVVFQVIVARIAIMIIGTVQTTASILLEWDQFGLYLAFVLEARYFQANAKAMIITGITTISINPMAVSISVLCSSPIAPLGSINAVLQPLNINAEANKDNIPILLLYFLSLI